jgi:hypothetical protein
LQNERAVPIHNDIIAALRSGKHRQDKHVEAGPKRIPLNIWLTPAVASVTGVEVGPLSTIIVRRL